MNQEIKQAFLNAMVARACYADIKKNDDLQLIKSQSDPLKQNQSAMTEADHGGICSLLDS